MNRKYKVLNQADIDFFKSVVGEKHALLSEEDRSRYGKDETEDLLFLPEIVLKPSTPEEISKLLAYCNVEMIPVTVRGGGTGLSGGALPVHGGVSLSIERLNRLIEIDRENLQATVEPGMVTQVFMDELAACGLMYPVDPSSKGSSMLGGNLAESSGGPRALKYGTVRDYVLNIEMVLADGTIVWTGANTLKYASGYNLTQLMVGSEGTLAIVTKIVFKLLPQVKHNLLLLAGFPSAEKACNAVSAVFQAGLTPSALEFMEADGIDWVCRYEGIAFQRPAHVQAYLLIEVDGQELPSLEKDCESIAQVLYQFDVDDVLFADSSAQKEEWWKMRRSMALSVKAHSIYKEEDTVVPRANLASLLKSVKSIGAEFGFQSVCYGHAGDGNLHINIIKSDMTDHAWKHELPLAIRKIFEETVRLGGTISGEHGIGYVQKAYMDIKYPKAHLALMKGIKAVFDPNGILNPGKIFME